MPLRPMWGILSTADKPEPRVDKIQRRGISFSENNGGIIKFHRAGIFNTGRQNENNKILVPANKVQFLPCGLKRGTENPGEIRNFCTCVDICQEDLNHRLNDAVDIIGMQQEELIKAKSIIAKQKLKIEDLSKKLSEGQKADTEIYKETIDKIMGELKYNKEELEHAKTRLLTRKQLEEE